MIKTARDQWNCSSNLFTVATIHNPVNESPIILESHVGMQKLHVHLTVEQAEDLVKTIQLALEARSYV